MGDVMKLDKKTVAALKLPPSKSEIFVWDDDLQGFGVRLRGAGVRWIVQYRVGAQQRRETLGDIRKVTLDAARKIARQRFAQAELGNDPVAEKARVRMAVATGVRAAGTAPSGRAASPSGMSPMSSGASRTTKRHRGSMTTSTARPIIA